MVDPLAFSWIDTVLARASELRAAGVTSIGSEGHTATFLPADTRQPIGDIAPPDELREPGDPLHDAASYPNGIVPGFQITKLEAVE